MTDLTLRAGRTLSKTEGLCTLYQVTPGDDRLADTCIGMVATPELAALIVGAVNGEQPQVEAAVRYLDQRLADVQQEMQRRMAPLERRRAEADAAIGQLEAALGRPRSMRPLASLAAEAVALIGHLRAEAGVPHGVERRDDE